MKNKSKMQLFLQILILLFGSATLLTFTYPILSEALNEIWNQNILAEFNKEQQSVQEMRKDWEKLNESQKNMALKDPYSEESLIASRGGTYPNPYYVKKMIGEIYLPTIHQMLPIFNETNDHLLQKGAGLAPGSDFVGDGKGSLILLAGHSGIPSANLFNDVPKLKKGELFFLYISQKYYAYKINTIVKVLPNEVKHLRKDPSKELTTLITCLPVGINTHRLLVTGERIPFTPEMKAKLGDLKKTENTKQKGILGAFVLFVFVFLMILFKCVSHYRKSNLRADMLLSGVEPNMEFQLFQKDGKTELKRKGELFKRMSDSKGSVCFEDLPHRQYVVKGGDGESIFIKGKVRKKSKGGLTFIRKT